ncbi:MAG: thioredoxin fold domain-containing protein [Winogradskyella sp.]|uniref:thioredoxin family protein n=1 Tax=Winogradskyella sp. TaxID=1883156 RepID=UPI00184ADF5E|nr:thioredoxin fold domain-containing protein [Winogradskyella sp.]MBT8245585.1 thioredoxin fold domain-containing protein [Winogradskyella sp.]NNK22855.1 thioredoxin fold domain-containing protein [Winogradskyella sp.]
MMKKIIISVFVLLLAINVSAQEINWVTFEEAVALQKKNPKKIMMDVYTNWCGPCKMLDRNTFKNKDVVAYVNKNFYAVKFNGEGNDEVTYKENTFKNPGYDPTKLNRRNSAHEFVRFFQIRAYPTIAFFDEELKLIAPITGYQRPQQLELYLKLFKDDTYKEMTSQEQFNDYYKAFKPTFSEGK